MGKRNVVEKWGRWFDVVNSGRWGDPTSASEEKLKSLNIPCKYIGWTSIDKVFAEKVNFSKAFVPVGKNIFRNPRPIFQAYLKIADESETLYKKLPTLYIPFNPNAIQINVPAKITNDSFCKIDFMIFIWFLFIDLI